MCTWQFWCLYLSPWTRWVAISVGCYILLIFTRDFGHLMSLNSQCNATDVAGAELTCSAVTHCIILTATGSDSAVSSQEERGRPEKESRSLSSVSVFPEQRFGVWPPSRIRGWFPARCLSDKRRFCRQICEYRIKINDGTGVWALGILKHWSARVCHIHLNARLSM